jgi:Ca2+-binding EF-hand superfamily protein
MKLLPFSRLIRVALALLVGAALNATVKAADAPPDDKETGKHTWNDVAESLFKKFDSHGHKFLDKAEFKKANAALDKVIRDLIKQGEIGQAPPSDGTTKFRRRLGQQQQATSTTPQFQPTFDYADADHDNKVSQSEFTAYVNAAIQAADQYVQAQQAAQNANSQVPSGVPVVRGRR